MTLRIETTFSGESYINEVNSNRSLIKKAALDTYPLSGVVNGMPESLILGLIVFEPQDFFDLNECPNHLSLSQ